MRYNLNKGLIRIINIKTERTDRAMARYQEENNYIGAWHYVGLEILYSIPVIGWIFLLVHCFIPEKENRMHFARHYFVRLLLAIIILLIIALVLYLTVGRQYMEHQNEIEDAFKTFQKNYEEINRDFNKTLNNIKFD